MAETGIDRFAATSRGSPLDELSDAGERSIDLLGFKVASAARTALRHEKVNG
jgi:hypothetical protein